MSKPITTPKPLNPPVVLVFFGIAFIFGPILGYLLYQLISAAWQALAAAGVR